MYVCAINPGYVNITLHVHLVRESYTIHPSPKLQLKCRTIHMRAESTVKRCIIGVPWAVEISGVFIFVITNLIKIPTMPEGLQKCWMTVNSKFGVIHVRSNIVY